MIYLLSLLILIGIIDIVYFIQNNNFTHWYNKLYGKCYIFHNDNDLYTATKIWDIVDNSIPGEFEKALIAANIHWNYE